MKRSVILILLLLAIGAFVLVPLLRNDGPDDAEVEAIAFGFDENIQTEYGKAIQIPIKVDPSLIRKVELIYNDSIFKSWDAPAGNLSYSLDAGYYGVGSKNIVVRGYLKSGGYVDDGQILRVVSDIAPKLLKAVVVSTSPHNPKNYTQGLEFHNGKLYEGTGNPQNTGESTIGIVNMSTGESSPKNALDATYFGEGLTIFGDNLYQLTWRDGRCFVYDKNTIQLKKEFNYTGDGWGLCNDGKLLIMSNGTEYLTFRDPKDFSIVKIIEVYDNVGPRVNLNELEYKDGKIYANVYMTDIVVVIDPNTGRVLEQIDASAVTTAGQMGGEVLNGIAWNQQTNKLYMTGKYWGKILEVKLEE